MINPIKLKITSSFLDILRNNTPQIMDKMILTFHICINAIWSAQLRQLATVTSKPSNPP